MGGNTKRGVSLSTPSSHLHPLPKVPEHTGSTEQIDSTHIRCLTRATTAMIREAEAEGEWPRHT